MRLATADGLARDLEAHRAELQRHCGRILQSAADADDAVQETIIRAWRCHDRFEGRSSLRSWLYRIATNVCIDQVRRRAVHAVPAEVEEDAVPPAHLTGRPPSPPDEAVVDGESVSHALATLTRLPSRQRAAVVLHDVFQWPAHEVAEMLGTTTPAVNSALQRARASLATRAEPATVSSRGLGADEARLLDRYADAFAGYDFAALVAIEGAAG